MFNVVAIPLTIYNTYRAFAIAQKVICKKPNDFWSIIAPPGTGKTTLAASLTRKALAEGRKVYSNVPIRGAIRINVKEDLGKYDLHDAVIIIDEAGSDLNNRNWAKNLTDACIEYIKKHRHYNIDIYCFSQAPNDMDNKFRDLVTKIYLLNKSKVPFMVYAQALRKVMKLENGQIVEYLEEERRSSFRFFMPPTWAYFNSYDRKMNLKPMEEHVYTVLDVKD